MSTPENAPASTSRKKLVIVVAAAALVLGGAGGGVWYFTKPATAAAVPQPTAGAVVALDPISVNLADGHYLKVGIALQATTVATTAPNGSAAENLVIDEFSNLTQDQVSTQRAALKTDLEKKVVAAYKVAGVEQVMGIDLTSFVTQ